MPAYAAAADVKNAVAAMLKMDESAMPAYWTTVTTRAALWSQYETQNRLLRRGFTPAQVLDWPMLDDMSLDLATWRALHLGGVYSQFEKGTLDALDVREQLDEALVWDSVLGEWVKPPMGSAGNAASTSGPVRQQGGIFARDENDDVHQGIHW